MKWFIIALVAAAALIGIGLVAAGPRGQAQLSRNPEAAALCEEGTADFHALRLQAAVEKLGRCLELDPSLAEASISRALALQPLGDRQGVKLELARADSLTGALTDERRRLIAQLRLSALPGSRFASLSDSLYAVLSAQEPDNIYVLEAGAARAARTMDDEQVEKAWRHVIAKNPNYAKSYNELGYLELNRGNYDLAIEHMQKYAFLAPELANPHDSLGDVYTVLGRYEDAESEYQTAIRMQPDFYFSLINLGRVYLARGEIRRGVEILEALRSQVAGSELEQNVDRELIRTYLRSGLLRELDQASARYISRYAEAQDTAIYRAVRLAYLGQFATARAVMDSSLAAWRAEPEYANSKKARRGVDFAEQQFAAITADLAGDSERAAAAWNGTLNVMQAGTPKHELFHLRYRLAAALRSSGHPREALAEIDPVLQVNPRLPEALLLKVRCHLDLDEREAAERTLAQLEWTLAKADPDLPVLIEATALRRQLGPGATEAAAATR